MPPRLPPLPGETFLSIAAVAERANCSRQAIYDALRDAKIAGFHVAGRTVIAESEAQRFIREWPVRTHEQAIAARWHEYRAWKAAGREARLKGRAV